MFCSEIIICFDLLKYCWAFISANTWPKNYRYDNSCHCDNERLRREENGEGEKKKEEIISNISGFLVSSHLQDYLWIRPKIRSEEQATLLKATQNKPLGYALVRVLKYKEVFKHRLPDKWRSGHVPEASHIRELHRNEWGFQKNTDSDLLQVCRLVQLFIK